MAGALSQCDLPILMVNFAVCGGGGGIDIGGIIGPIRPGRPTGLSRGPKWKWNAHGCQPQSDRRETSKLVPISIEIYRF